MDLSKSLALSHWDWRWALSKKENLEAILSEIKRRNGMLKELVPPSIALRQCYANQHQSTGYTARSMEEGMARLGLTTHQRLRMLNIDPTLDMDSTHVYLGKVSPEIPKATPMAPLLFGGFSRAANVRENVLVEHKPIVHHQDAMDAPKDDDVLRLASSLLLAGELQLGTLPFVGYFKNGSTEPPQYAFLFRYPEKALESSPISLHDVIASASDENVLRGRFIIAYRVAMSLYTFHTDNWIHMSVRSQSIAFFRDHGNSMMYEAPYLINFEYSRPANHGTTWTWDQDDEKNLYRHPDRQGPPVKSFDKTHDAYALGVVLLEIGLWQTASELRTVARKAASSTGFDRYSLRTAYVASAKQQLPRLMGCAYQNAVVTCLSGDYVSGA